MKLANPSFTDPVVGDTLTMGRAQPDAIGTQLRKMDPISLAELNDQARLMTRVDRKYFLPRELFIQLLDAVQGGFRVLEIGEQRRFEYRTVYFDSPDFRFFRDHVQGRRHRYKVRTRTYMETGTCHLEVKSKGYRGQTVKERIPHSIDEARSLSDADSDFIGSIVGAGTGQLEPVLETIYDRVTLCHDHQRLTCDLDIRALNGEATHEGPRDVLVETKSADGGGVWDTLLKEVGVRPHKVSKYCVAASLLYPDLPSNPWRRTIKQYFA